MPIGRCCAAVLLLFQAATAAAQSEAQSAAQSTAAPPTRPARAADVVVVGGPERKGAWKRAESDHVVVTSQGSEAELRRIVTTLEQLHAVMSRLYRRGAQGEDALKLQVTLVDTADRFRAMGLRNLRSAEGPYAANFTDQRYYDPREDGDVLAVPRTDRMVLLTTHRRETEDCDDYYAHGGEGLCKKPHHPPLGRPWEAALYSAFAQHFVLTYLPAAYPRWYLDGLGALFSTVAVRRDGTIDYAHAPDGYRDVLRSYGNPNVGDVLSGRYLDPGYKGSDWTPYHAWLLAHFFLFSALKPERSAQFQQYMTAIHQGTPPAEAARIFGNLDQLQREIVSYAGRSTTFARADPPAAPGTEPAITTLSPGSAALVEARVELGTRLAAGPAGTDWLAQLRDKAAGFPDDAEVTLMLAEAECRSGHPAECRAAADRVLAGAPETAAALAWKGVALTDQAVAGPTPDRTALATARTTIERAIALDGQAPLPRIAYFQSFTKAGERASEPAMAGLARVVQANPAAPAPRLYLAEELVRQGKPDLARRLLYPVLYGPYDSPEKTAAAALFKPAG